MQAECPDPAARILAVAFAGVLQSAPIESKEQSQGRSTALCLGSGGASGLIKLVDPLPLMAGVEKG